MAVKSLKSYSTLFYIVLLTPWESVFLYVLVMHTALTTLQLSLPEIESVKNTVNRIIQFLLIQQPESLSPNEHFPFHSLSLELTKLLSQEPSNYVSFKYF